MRNKEEKTSPFRIVKRGYERAEVDERIAELQATYQADTEELIRSVASLELDLEAAREREEAVSLTLVAATRTKEEILEGATKIEDEARSKAEKMMAEARYEAFRLVTDARKEGDTVLVSARRDAGGVTGNILGAEARTSDHEALADGEEAEARARAAKLRAAVRGLEERLRTFTTDLAPEVAGLEALLSSSNGNGHIGRRSDFVTDETVGRQPPLSPSADISLSEAGAPTSAFPSSDAEPVLEAPSVEEVPAQLRDPETADDDDAGAHLAFDPAPVSETELIQVEEPIEHPPQNLTDEATHSLADLEAAQTHPEPDEDERRASSFEKEEAHPPPASLTDRPSFESNGATDPDDVVSERGSFYSRRSARLPRIGDEASKEALAAMSGLRGQLTSGDADDKQDGVEDDLAAQTI